MQSRRNSAAATTALAAGEPPPLPAVLAAEAAVRDAAAAARGVTDPQQAEDPSGRLGFQSLMMRMEHGGFWSSSSYGFVGPTEATLAEFLSKDGKVRAAIEASTPYAKGDYGRCVAVGMPRDYSSPIWLGLRVGGVVPTPSGRRKVEALVERAAAVWNGLLVCRSRVHGPRDCCVRPRAYGACNDGDVVLGFSAPVSCSAWVPWQMAGGDDGQ